MNLRAFLAILLMLIGGACADGSEETQTGERTLTGLITSIESEGPEEVTAFDLEEEGEVHTILIDDSVDYGFPLSHLEEHRVGALPVEVDVVERDGDLYARSIADVEE